MCVSMFCDRSPSEAALLQVLRILCVSSIFCTSEILLAVWCWDSVFHACKRCKHLRKATLYIKNLRNMCCMWFCVACIRLTYFQESKRVIYTKINEVIQNLVGITASAFCFWQQTKAVGASVLLVQLWKNYTIFALLVCTLYHILLLMSNTDKNLILPCITLLGALCHHLFCFHLWLHHKATVHFNEGVIKNCDLCHSRLQKA